MVTIRKRGAKWQAQVRRKGTTPQSRTFTTKPRAQKWAYQLESDIEGGLHQAQQSLKATTISQLLIRYRDNVVARKRAAPIETFILNRFLREPLAGRPLTEATTATFAEFRDYRLTRVKPVTVCRELGLISHAFEIARREWGIPLTPNPLRDVDRPKILAHRQRRLSTTDQIGLQSGLTKCRNPLMAPLIWLAVETAMRQGELLQLKWRDIFWETGTLVISLTKNGHPRVIPLSQTAIDLLRKLSSQQQDDERVFPLTACSVKLAWRRLVKRAKIRDLHFHDLRHEAISRFFEMGLSVPEVALISGHKDARMLFRYAHMRVEELSIKLRTS